jgi:hypothetical protein
MINDSVEQVTKGLLLMDKLLVKDVAKRLSSKEAKEARDKVSVMGPDRIKGTWCNLHNIVRLVYNHSYDALLKMMSLITTVQIPYRELKLFS